MLKDIVDKNMDRFHNDFMESILITSGYLQSHAKLPKEAKATSQKNERVICKELFYNLCHITGIDLTRPSNTDSINKLQALKDEISKYQMTQTNLQEELSQLHERNTNLSNETRRLRGLVIEMEPGYLKQGNQKKSWF